MHVCANVHVCNATICTSKIANHCKPLHFGQEAELNDRGFRHWMDQHSNSNSPHPYHLIRCEICCDCDKQLYGGKAQALMGRWLGCPVENCPDMLRYDMISWNVMWSGVRGIIHISDMRTCARALNGSSWINRRASTASSTVRYQLNAVMLPIGIHTSTYYPRYRTVTSTGMSYPLWVTNMVQPHL